MEGCKRLTESLRRFIVKMKSQMLIEPDILEQIYVDPKTSEEDFKKSIEQLCTLLEKLEIEKNENSPTKQLKLVVATSKPASPLRKTLIRSSTVSEIAAKPQKRFKNVFNKRFVHKAIPLCLPENLKWNTERGCVEKMREDTGCEKLVLVPQALDILDQIDCEIGVVSIIGPYRGGKQIAFLLFLSPHQLHFFFHKGKSYFASKMVGGTDCFDLGHTTNACTKGVWMWGSPIFAERNGKKIALLMLDTEGLNAPTATKQSDNAIACFSLIFSSMFIYNSKGVADSHTLEHLEFISKV